MPMETAGPACLVALKAKEGELAAVRHGDARTASRVVHLVEVLDTAGRDGGRILPALVRTAAHLVELGHPMWLDTRWLTADSPLRQAPGGRSTSSTTWSSAASTPSTACSPPRSR